ncbi:glycoside hydrolase family 97 protein [Rhodohalobacter sp. 8-1]|uniref:glycoside hydrolase family 97 protein n=1 Tax=Rhodohalobacter sp. 8-1 TaxID=3131972 RepID=UPI0030EC59C0
MTVMNTGWSETNPSYEEYYEIGIDVGRPSTLGVGWSYPALFQIADNDWLLIIESGMDGSYPGTRLRTVSEDGVYQVGYPADEEVVTGRIRGPLFETPWQSPWRVIAIGDLEAIVESTLGTDLAKPTEYKETSYIDAGRASWSWVKLKDASVNYDRQVEFIDYAADMEWEYTLIDVNWYETIGYDRIQELVNYADDKGVGIWIWYNSSGDWNSSPYTPKSALLTEADRREELSRLQKIGIRGIKVDFFPGDGQSALQYYIDILEDAHNYQLMVNTHGSTLPRGWHRTYPNLMTMESVRGFEFKTFEQANQNEAPSHATVLPFTRNVFDPMDYTPMSLDEIPGIDRVTTSVQELAHPIIFLSGVQHFAETAEGMERVPQYIKETIKQIPAALDETQFVDGYPGEFVIIARRSGTIWFLAGINGEEESKTVEFELPFLSGSAEGTIITDGKEPMTFSHDTFTHSPGDYHTVMMKPNGGFVITFKISDKR